MKYERADKMVDIAAKALYMTHWREPSPVWESASDNVKDWCRDQALEVIVALDRMHVLVEPKRE